MPDDRFKDWELLEVLADLYRQGALYIGYRPNGHNDEYRYISLQFKVPLPPPQSDVTET